MVTVPARIFYHDADIPDIFLIVLIRRTAKEQIKPRSKNGVLSVGTTNLEVPTIYYIEGEVVRLGQVRTTRNGRQLPFIYIEALSITN